MLRIVNYPHPALRYQSRPVTQIDADLRATVQEMFSLMYAARGVGLAANQVALPYRFFILNLTADPEQKDQELVFINPEIVKRHSSIEDEEGCLSLPGVYSKVRRAKKIKVQAYNLEGELVEHEAEDLLAALCSMRSTTSVASSSSIIWARSRGTRSKTSSANSRPSTSRPGPAASSLRMPRSSSSSMR